MKITGKQLKQLIQEMTDMHAIGGPPVDLGPLEYRLVSVIVNAWEDSVKAENFEGTYETWPQEIDNAGAELEDLLMNDPEVLSSLLVAINEIEQRLHGGEFAR
jgi:hypothetical protein